MAGDEFHPIQHIDPRSGSVVPHKIEDDKRISFKFDSTNIEFQCYARPGTTIDEAKWKISRDYYDASGDSNRRNWMESSDYYENIVDNSANLLLSAASKANPCELTFTAAHNLDTDHFIEITGTVGMTELNSNGYGTIVFQVVKVDATKVTLKRASTGAAINSTAYGTWSSGGIAKKKNLYNATYS